MVCVANQGYGASLEVRKIYHLLEPLAGDPKAWLRVVDESGEDYLYPQWFFRRLALSPALRRALQASGS